MRASAAMVLAAGLGTRLRPLSDELPKPLVPIGDRPALAHVLDRLRAGGIARAVLNTFHLPAAFTPPRLEALPLPLEIVRETELLGTAGGVANAADRLGEGDVLLWNADVLADVDVGALFALQEATGAAATLAAAPRAVGEGTLGVGAEGRVVRLRAERFGVEVGGADFLGVHVLGAGCAARCPPSGAWSQTCTCRPCAAGPPCA
ncbi:MAG: sugar phosphate nucleotidyltransferase [Polyangiaceae bacterium]